jgi:hypothetical protein
MATAAWEIDRIVREVIKRLRDDATNPHVAETNVGPTVSATEPIRSEPHSPRDLRVADRVVSLAAIDGRLDGIRRLITRCDAVITPSVRDEIRQRGIVLVRGDGPEADPATQTKKVLAVVGEASGQLIAELEPLVGRVVRFPAGDLVTAVRQLTREVTSRDVLGVLLTAQPVVAQYLANRVDEVRATWAVDEKTLRGATETIGANLLVVDANRGSPAATASLVRQFVAAPRRVCPSALTRMIELMR